MDELQLCVLQPAIVGMHSDQCGSGQRDLAVMSVLTGSPRVKRYVGRLCLRIKRLGVRVSPGAFLRTSKIQNQLVEAAYGGSRTVAASCVCLCVRDGQKR
jgi:hypothetical protein